MCYVYKLYSPEQECFPSFSPFGTIGQPRGLHLMRQTLLLAGRLVCQSNPPCRDASPNPLLLLSIHVSASWALTHHCDAHLSVSVCLPVLGADCYWAKPHNHLPSAWLPFSETRIMKMLFRCKPQQSAWNPSTLAHSCIVSEM